MSLKVGTVYRYERVFSVQDVAAFAELSGDAGRHHVEPDALGRLVVHGLLVVAVPTAVGREIHYLARDMQWMFIRPVYTGERIIGEVTLLEVLERDERFDVAMRVIVRNGEGRIAVRGESRGVVLKQAPPM